MTTKEEIHEAINMRLDGLVKSVIIEDLIGDIDEILLENQKQIFSVSAAAKYLGVHRLSVRNWTKKGKLKSFRTPGGHRRFKKEELDKVMAGRKK